MGTGGFRGQYGGMYMLHYAPDNASQIIRLALEELRAPHTLRLVNRAEGDQDSAAYRALAPTGLIPALVTPQGVMFETGAILLWLADIHGALAPAPTDPARGDFLKWLFFIANSLHADLRAHFYPDRYAGATPAPSAFTAATRSRLARHAALLNDAATQTPALFWAEGGPTLLCLYLAPLIRWLHLYPEGQPPWFRLTDYPAIAALMHEVEARPAAQKVAAAEGLGPHPYSAPTYAAPPEGSPT